MKDVYVYVRTYEVCVCTLVGMIVSVFGISLINECVGMSEIVSNEYHCLCIVHRTENVGIESARKRE